MSQFIEGLTVGAWYQLKFSGFAGDWDGLDTDIVRVGIGNGNLEQKDYNVEAGYSVQRGDGKDFTVKFQAKAAGGTLSFWAGVGSCIDVNGVSIYKLKETSTLTTTSKTTTTISRTTTTNTLLAAVNNLPSVSGSGSPSICPELANAISCHEYIAHVDADCRFVLSILTQKSISGVVEYQPLP